MGPQLFMTGCYLRFEGYNDYSSVKSSSIDAVLGDLSYRSTEVILCRSGFAQVKSHPFGNDFAVEFSIDLSDKRKYSKEEEYLFDDTARQWVKDFSRARKRKPVYDKAISDFSRLGKEIGIVQSHIDALPVIAASPTSFAEAIEAGVPIADLLA